MASSPTDRVVTVERVIAAPPEKIFDVLADPRRHREIDGSGTLREADPDGPTRLSLGSKFAMAMKLGVKYRMVNTVIEFDENRRIAWAPRPEVKGKEKPNMAGRVWRYELEPVEGGTLVRESWDATNEKGYRFVKLLGAPKKARTSMTETLERLARVVAA